MAFKEREVGEEEILEAAALFRAWRQREDDSDGDLLLPHHPEALTAAFIRHVEALLHWPKQEQSSQEVDFRQQNETEIKMLILNLLLFRFWHAWVLKLVLADWECWEISRPTAGFTLTSCLVTGLCDCERSLAHSSVVCHFPSCLLAQRKSSNDKLYKSQTEQKGKAGRERFSKYNFMWWQIKKLNAKTNLLGVIFFNKCLIICNNSPENLREPERSSGFQESYCKPEFIFCRNNLNAFLFSQTFSFTLMFISHLFLHFKRVILKNFYILIYVIWVTTKYYKCLDILMNKCSCLDLADFEFYIILFTAFL